MEKLILTLVSLLVTTASLSQQVNHPNIPYNNLSMMSVLDDFVIEKGTHSYLQNGDLWLYSNFVNKQTFTHDPSNKISVLRFRGNKQQRVSGTGVTHVYDLLINNNTPADAIELDSDILVNNDAQFLDGIVGADDSTYGLLTFNVDATTSMVSDDGYVDGPVKKIGNQAFTFPIGDDNGSLFKYRPLSISSPYLITDEFVSQYFFKNSNSQYTHTNKEESIAVIDDKEYWTLDRVTGNSPVSVTLSWDTDTTPANLLSNLSTLTIARWDGSQWKNERTSETAIKVDPTSQTITVVNPTGYGTFTLAADISSEVEVFNLITPNDDGINERFYISGIDPSIDVSVKIYNRWDILVYEQSSYGKNGAYFTGYSEGRSTVSKGKPLPSGTYYYQVSYEDTNGKEQTLTGYLYIQN